MKMRTTVVRITPPKPIRAARIVESNAPLSPEWTEGEGVKRTAIVDRKAVGASAWTN